MTPREALEWEVRRGRGPVYRAPVRIGGVAAWIVAAAILAWTVFGIIDGWLP